MATVNTNEHLIQIIETNCPILKAKGLNEYRNYIESLKDEQFEEQPYEKEEDAIKRAEGIFDRLDEMIKRNELTNKKALKTIKVLKKMSDCFVKIVNNAEDEKILLVIKNNELIDQIIDLEQRKTTKLTQENEKRKNELNGGLKDKKEELEQHRINLKETHQKPIIKPISIPSLNTLNINEMKQLEEWTGMKVGNIIFDSNVDNWRLNTSVFDEKIINKSNLIFLIEDEDDNKFGGYVNAIINNVGQLWINDSKSFVFSLKSNGRLNGMLKFDIKQPQYAFCLYKKSEAFLFSIGEGIDISIIKERYKNDSSCEQLSFNYNEIQNALCGSQYPRVFTPKRITVIQLI